MKILKYKKISSGKYELELENHEKIKLYEDVILKEELLLKKQIDDIDEILKTNDKYAIYDIALKYLSHHVVSCLEMKNYLLKKGYEESEVQNNIDELINNGYLNDEYYAKCYINDHVKLSNDGPLKIQKHLSEAGISSTIYDKYLNYRDKIWQERLQKYLNKQLKINKKSLYLFKSKMLMNLLNLGYEREMINEALNNIHIDNLDDIKKKEEEKIRKKLSSKYKDEELERKIKEKLYQKGFFNN